MGKGKVIYMTLKEKVIEVFPSRVGDGSMGGVRSCPKNYEFLKNQNQLCENQCSSSEARCTKCWNQEFKESEKVMTKSDLKTGMRVEAKNGYTYIVFENTNDGLIAVKTSGWISLGDRTEDLRSIVDSSYDIVKVFEAPSTYALLDIDRKGVLLWELNPPKKMTVSEIAKELGYEIEIVK